MKLFIAALLAGASVATTCALAQDSLPQADSPWFKVGQDTLAANLAKQPNTNRAKNIILFTADGQGVGTNYAIRLFSGQLEGLMGSEYVQPQETFPHLALVKTYTTNGQTPDSAPTAGAMNTGVKQKNGMINVDPSVARGDCAAITDHELTTFGEIVKTHGKSVGVVSTARLTHATPAGVYAKTVDRNWEDNSKLPEGCTAQKDIAAQLFDAIEAGKIDIALGGGRRHFLPKEVKGDEGKSGKRTDGRNLIKEIQDLGGQYAWNQATFDALDLASDKPVIGMFESSHMKYDVDRTDEPSLAEMTAAAIEKLSQNENGFFLDIEAGRVDHANHAGNGARAMHDGKAFADAIAKAMEMTDEADTLIIVTADHEHAIAFNGYCGRGSPVLGLCYDVNKAGEMHTDKPLLADDGKPYTVIGYLNGVGSVLKKQDDGSYSGSRPDLSQEEALDKDYVQQALIPMSSETHSGEDVAVYARGPWSHLFDGTIEQNYIFHVMNHAANNGD